MVVADTDIGEICRTPCGHDGMTRCVKVREGDKDLDSSCSCTQSGTNSGVVVMAKEGVVATCPSCSLTPNRHKEETSNVHDSWRLAMIGGSP
jgi:hypothetical protein